MTLTISGPLPDIPQELVDHIFHSLADDKNALKNCSLVSKAVARICRSHLFRSVTLQAPPYYVRLQGELYPREDKSINIWQMLHRHPYLLQTIKVLIIESGAEQMYHRRFLMRPFTTTLFPFQASTQCALEEFKLVLQPERKAARSQASQHQDWDDIRSFFSCQGVSRCSVMVTLDLEGIQCFPYEFLRLFPNLRKLRFAPGKNLATRGWNERSVTQQPTLPQEGCINIQELELVELLDRPTWFYLVKSLNYSTMRKLTVVHRSSEIMPQLHALLVSVGPYIEELTWNPSTTLGGGEGLPLTTFTKLHALKLTGIHPAQFNCQLLQWIYGTIKNIPRSTSSTTNKSACTLERITLDFPHLELSPGHSSLPLCSIRHPEIGDCRLVIDLPLYSSQLIAQMVEVYRSIDAMLDEMANFKCLKVVVATQDSDAELVQAFPLLAKKNKAIIEQIPVCWHRVQEKWDKEELLSKIDDVAV
ncbi:hypothetical protein BDN72DRAFT_896693 [Pluteus cervinus]|uniref:Uncharacterized protein n=1 Tax=Pluteus cervinus TaxID=181527 RepID=A0ACD3AXN7_9AGAR|nr:hypothetical protein BDN72DRAFT_896693 [Pluteus cervinus]